MKFNTLSFIASAAACLFLEVPAHAQKPAPAKPEEKAAEENPAANKEGIVRFEVISLPTPAARKALLKYPDEPALYQWLDKEMENKDSGVVLEQMSAQRVRSGQRGKAESIHEHAYATETNPPQIPQTLTIADPAALRPLPAGPGRVFPPWPYSATTSSSHTFRNLGLTAEVELTIGEDGKSVDLNLAPEIVKLAAMVPQGVTEESMQPVHETQKANTQVLTTLGAPALVSTLSPPTGTGAPGGNKADRIWLLFVTVTRPE
ncbi:MAG TPA: hypothetical protein VHM91_05430 [Verrucomicrobiales bacterium]|nr:hypothetical protein [Verrucomicrobiales bacterium]